MVPSSSVFPGAVTQLPEEGEESAAQATHQQQVGQDEEAEIHNLEIIVIIIVTIITIIIIHYHLEIVPRRLPGSLVHGGEQLLLGLH